MKSNHRPVFGSISNMAEGSNINDVSHGVGRISLQETSLNENSSSNGFEFTESTTGDLPNIIIVTNIDVSVFENAECKHQFEALFSMFDSEATFQYLKSFRRARIHYTCCVAAAKARVHLHETEFAGKSMKCFFAQPIQLSPDNSSPHLQPPKPTKQFLISPPASPPVGWEPVLEAEPVINYELLSAIANLAPGQAHELHPASEEQPGIVVHICENPDGYENRPQLMQTRRPDYT